LHPAKVIGVGFHKTGTKTLARCLSLLGFRHQSISRHHFELWLAGQTDQLLQHMHTADSFEDWPWPLIFRQASLRFPEARFVLTTRVNEHTWYQSLRHHVERQGDRGYPYRKAIYGYLNPADDPAHHCDVYRAHNQTVRRFFVDQPHRLIELCWERGDGWDQLCGFLGLPVPPLPFPHANRAEESETGP
jgi:hypothetical protein